MTRYLLIAIIAITALLSLGCDRFTHNFQPPVTTDFEAELFTPLQTAFTAQPVDGVEMIMHYYTDDYLHFGQNKGDRRNWLEGLYQVEPDLTAEVTLLQAEELSDSTAVANWRLLCTSATGRTVLADSTFIGERLVKRNGNWLLKGNQMICEVPTQQQRIIIEYFSFLGCPNCPVVEAELHDLQLQYPSQLSYLEHHVSGPLVVPGDGTFTYYGSSTVPASVFQGETKLIGSATDILEAYSPLVQSLSNIDTNFEYNNLVFNVDGQNVTGSITLESLDPEFDYTNLVLNYVIIDKISTYNNTQGIPLKNLVRAKGSLDISMLDLANPVLFTLDSSVAIPDDAALVMFVQTKPSVFANNATIHSGIEVPLFPAAGKLK